jgi:hypothetical protein
VGYCRLAAHSRFLREEPEVLVSVELSRRQPAAAYQALTAADRERYHRRELPGAPEQQAAQRSARPRASARKKERWRVPKQLSDDSAQQPAAA